MKRVANPELGRVFNIENDHLDYWLAEDYLEISFAGEPKKRPAKKPTKKPK